MGWPEPERVGSIDIPRNNHLVLKVNLACSNNVDINVPILDGWILMYYTSNTIMLITFA